MTEERVLQLFKCLADRSRLRIVQSLLREEMYVERLNESDGVLSGFVTMTLHGDTDVTVTLDASFLVDYLSVMRVLNSATALVYMQYVEGTPMTIIK